MLLRQKVQAFQAQAKPGIDQIMTLENCKCIQSLHSAVQSPGFYSKTIGPHLSCPASLI